MKMDRLLGIVIYLLNRETVSSRELAAKFEVSQRTIQRDIESIGHAGIPVGSQQGLNGGYYILDSFKMSRQLLQSEDYAYILTSLKGLLSGYSNMRARDTVEKMTALAAGKSSPGLPFQLDLGVLREGEHTAENIAMMEKAIKEHTQLRLQYTDTHNDVSERCVEPLLLTYQWYAWYLFAYCCGKEDYRLFRLSRVRQIHLTSQPFSHTHREAEMLLAEHGDTRAQVHVRLVSKAANRVLLAEAFSNAEIREVGEDEIIMSFSVPQSEEGWFGRLLQYGHLVTVLEPESLRQRMRRQAERILIKHC
ncbi:helix-turn-helix transcriptional regulator [Paenibacillus sp. sgz5001063]|uniref:helix-turn-helix transcriptional regulator n=1 Tax=Paenibacillus sp. sgz5001063 TaxID=3242474 RepID=UPI0036D346CA